LCSIIILRGGFFSYVHWPFSKPPTLSRTIRIHHGITYKHARTHHVVCRRVKTPNLSSPLRPVCVREIVVIKRQLINYLEKRIITTTSSLHIHARARVYVERRKLERENVKIAAKVENKIKNKKNNYVTKVAWENIVLFYIFLCRGSRYRARAVHYYTQAYYILRVYIIYYYRGYNIQSLT